MVVDDGSVVIDEKSTPLKSFLRPDPIRDGVRVRGVLAVFDSFDCCC